MLPRRSSPLAAPRGALLSRLPATLLCRLPVALLGRLPVVLLACALALPAALPARAQDAPLDDLAKFPQAELTVRSGAAVHHFHIWVADTPAHEEQGLMFVRELPADEGMVFVEPAPKVWGMWMRNTFIGLDMLWVAEDGRVVKIAEHARPHDETTLEYPAPVKAVIELPDGTASKLGLKVGDHAEWKAEHGAGQAAG